MHAGKRSRFFETRFFGLVIGASVVLVLIGLENLTLIPERLELKMLDIHFNLKNVVRPRTVQEGVTLEARNPNISPDILIVGIDFNTLGRFGKWPFPRYRHANLIDAFTRIQDQGQRERSLFFDIFFIEPDERAFDDALLVESIRNNGRVFLETVLEIGAPPAGTEEEYFGRQRALFETHGEITNVLGDFTKVPPYLGLQPPLIPYGVAAAGYGHANFEQDFDKVFRRQALIAKSSELIEIIKLEDLTVSYPVDTARFERIAWVDTDGFEHNVPTPLTRGGIADLASTMDGRAPRRAEDTNNDGKPDLYYHVVRKYRDRFVPAITLALALHHVNKTVQDLEVVLGQHIRIPSPEYFDVKTQSWGPYSLMVKPAEFDKSGIETKPGVFKTLSEIVIPINVRGEMLVNFMGIPSVSGPGGHQTFPVRSYSGYAARVPGTDPADWPATKAVANKILMVGPFAKGMAADEKPTPFGLMYGVEIHANALNTILMNKFIRYAPGWTNYAVLAGLVLLVAFMASRLATIFSMIVTFVLIIAFFIVVTVIFEHRSYVLNFSLPGMGIALTFLSVVVYRVMTEEKDKRRIRDMFGKYVSPSVVDEILENPPELGGVDRELTVMFSDIRGFTTLSESMTPQELVNHLNVYLTAMTDIILEYRGTLDKYIGDAIMCFWGAPLPQADHAYLACETALKQIEALDRLNADWPAEKRIKIGIGINSGIMTVGNMGSLGRMNYTLMGDNVNLGSRLEGINKEYGSTIIMSEYTYGLVRDRVVARELDIVNVKGKMRPVGIWELVDTKEGMPIAAG